MDIQFENIVPWNGSSDTGRDVRMKWERNFAKIGVTFQQIDELLGLLADELESKLSRVDPDTAQSIITFLSGLHIGQYTPGALGSGGAITVDPKTGHTRMEVDEGYFRKKATFNTVEIMHVTHRSGEDLYTPAGMVCTGVEEFDDFYRCYMNTDDGTKAVVNKFVVNDQAQCRDFNIKPGVYENVSNQYYWRLVIGVGEDYIDLSKTDCDTGSMIPLSGDKIAQLGNRTDPYR